MILNKGDETTTYRISLVPLLKTDPGKDAQEWIRFSPRRASLALSPRGDRSRDRGATWRVDGVALG